MARDLAITVARHRLHGLEDARPRPVLVHGVLTVAFLVGASLWSPELWLGVVVFGGLCVASVLQARWLRRRLHELRLEALRR